MNIKARPETQLTPLVEHIQLIIIENVKRHIYINYQAPPPPKFQPVSSEAPWIIGQGKPRKSWWLQQPENRDQSATSEERVNPRRRNRRTRRTGLTSWARSPVIYNLGKNQSVIWRDSQRFIRAGFRDPQSHKVPLIKMEDGSPFDIRSWNLSARPRPRLNCQNILFLERRPQLLRVGRRRAKDSILICHFWFGRTLSRIGSALHILLSFNEK